MITLLGIPFDFMGMTYYRTDKDISVGNNVVVKTSHGTFVGTVVKTRVATEEELKRKISTPSSQRLKESQLFPIVLSKEKQKQKNFRYHRPHRNRQTN